MQIRAIRDVFTMASQLKFKVVYGLSNGAIFIALEQLNPVFKRLKVWP